MKKLPIVLLLIVTLAACQKEEENQSACNDPKFSRSESFMNIKARILPEIVQGKVTGAYIIQRLNANAASLKPCNLPQVYQVDSLRVNVSGYFLYFEGMEYMNLSSLPIEVTQIQKQE